ncbi:hypothetical protein K7432_000659 [Basidiobolus ranarum]|uniref:NDT80 domain-containing protein n=1 Tax=Basidiobolus ranarum TaxID=34480 RepID=A0ABR2X488_9FUNG
MYLPNLNDIPAFNAIPPRNKADSLGLSKGASPYFTETHQHAVLYSLDRTRGYTVQIHSKFGEDFFLAEDKWTCYRRNYFQVSNSFVLLGSDQLDCPCLVEVNDVQHRVIQFHVGITAKVSNSNKMIDLIQHTPKRDKGPQITPTTRPIRAQGSTDLFSEQTTVTFERIQFKTATANNGKKRAAQQHFVLVVDLFAECDNGRKIKVATTQSASLVVRGRSPSHYAESHFNIVNLTLPV